MTSETIDCDGLEVTVEVVPQTVNEIIYLSEDFVTNNDSNSYVASEEETEVDDTNETYEIGSVDPTRLRTMSLVLDESESFVLLSQDGNIETAKVEYVVQSSDISEECATNEWDTYVFECNECPYRCQTLNDLTEHSKIHKQARNEHVCKVCGKNFDKAQSLSYHFKISHQAPHLICNICDCPCVSGVALLTHYKKHEPKAFSCNVCNAEYDNAVSLTNHLKTHSTTLLFACSKCDASFSSTSEVSYHLRTVHAERGKTKLQKSVVNALIESQINESENDAEKTRSGKQNRKRKRE